LPVGRPSKYTPELVAKARLYVNGGYAKAGDVVPQIAGLACELGIRRETIYAWVQDPEKEDFSNIVADCLSAQERKLFNGSLSGDLNPAISKLMLTKHGYSERVQQEHMGENGGPIKNDWTVRLVDARDDAAG
jgi:hypothetical protein